MPLVEAAAAAAVAGAEQLGADDAEEDFDELLRVYFAVHSTFLDLADDGAAQDLLRPKAKWHNDPLRPKTMEQALQLLGDHVEHFTRFTPAQLVELVGQLGVPPEICVKG